MNYQDQANMRKEMNAQDFEDRFEVLGKDFDVSVGNEPYGLYYIQLQRQEDVDIALDEDLDGFARSEIEQAAIKWLEFESDEYEGRFSSVEFNAIWRGSLLVVYASSVSNPYEPREREPFAPIVERCWLCNERPGNYESKLCFECYSWAERFADEHNFHASEPTERDWIAFHQFLREEK